MKKIKLKSDEGAIVFGASGMEIFIPNYEKGDIVPEHIVIATACAIYAQHITQESIEETADGLEQIKK